MSIARLNTYAIDVGATLAAGGYIGIDEPSITPYTAGPYRSSQALLFQPVDVASRPSVLGGGEWSLDQSEQLGPTSRYISRKDGWPWINSGGDWRDLNGVAQGPTPWVTAPLNSAAGEASSFVYTGINVTALAQAAITSGGWMALYLKADGGARSIASTRTAGGHHSVAYVYTDGTTETVSATTTALSSTSSTDPVTTTAFIAMPAFLEFPKPIKPLVSATMTLRVVAHWSGNSTLQVMLLNPTVNTDPDTATGFGLSQSGGNYDSGLGAVPGVLGSHRYEDGSVESAFLIRQNSNKGSEFNYSPNVINGGGAVDTSKWPYTTLGKWLVPASGGNVALVNSTTLTSAGVTPLATGLGALQITLPDSGLSTGDVCDNNGTLGADLLWFLPAGSFGIEDHVFVRYYVWIKEPHDATPADRKEFLRGGSPVFSEMSGKWGITPSAANSDGGFSGQSGGPYGWQFRKSWYEATPGVPGPNRKGTTVGFHIVDDFKSNNPVGHRYGISTDAGAMDTPAERWGQRGGKGAMIYAGRWVLIETELKLNTASNAGTWSADGYVRSWMDGCLVYEKTGMVMRTLPKFTPAYSASHLRPALDLGITHIALNWFHGGQTPNTRARTTYYAAVAFAESRIGAMKAPAATLPTWVPAFSATQANVTTLTVANGGLANNVASQCAPTHDPYYLPTIFTPYSGGCLAPDYGTHGAMLYFGGGHASCNDNSLLMLIAGEICRWKRANAPSAPFGSGDAVVRSNNSFADFTGPPIMDQATASFTIDGQPAAPHSYGMPGVMPATGPAPNGTFFIQSIAAGNRDGTINTGSFTSYQLVLPNEATSPDAIKISKIFTHPTAPTGTQINATNFSTAPGHTVFDQPSNRRFFIDRTFRSPRWYDHNAVTAAAAYVQGTGAAWNVADGNTIAAHMAVSVPTRRLAVYIYKHGGVSGTGALKLIYMDLSVTQPGWSALAPPVGLQVQVDDDWCCAAWCSDLNKIIVGDLKGNRAQLLEITVPATLTDTWAFELVPMSAPCLAWKDSASRSSDNGQVYNKWAYNPKLKCFPFFNNPSNSGGADVVYAIRPRGVV